MESLQAEGLDLVAVKHGAWADVFAHPGDEARLRALGATFELRDDDVEGHAAERAARELAGRPRPAAARVWSAAREDGVYRVEALPPVGSGSMGGYWTLAEVKMKLDSLVATDTRDLVADKIDTVGTTVEGRPIWALRIARAVEGVDTRPVVFYNALTHAREPEGMQSLFWFVDDLLARYDTDPFARDLLDHRVIEICPVVNPDGYAYNQATWPGGGGTWRKNRRNNGTSYGVDLNRNYGYKWGYDNLGSSGTPASETYRGTAAFSEPEARAQRDAVLACGPVMGICYHTYGNHWLNPWGYVAQSPPDSAAFRDWDDLVTYGTSYISGPGSTTLYVTNGDFNDWAYGDTTKTRCWSWTPEIGTDDDGFWPLPSRIVPLAQENLRSAYVVAALAGPYVTARSSALAGGELIAGGSAQLAVRARNHGLLASPAGLVATLVPLDAGTSVLGGPAVTYPAMASLTDADAADGGTFTIAADDTVTPGRRVRFELDFQGNGCFSRDTVDLLVGRPTVVLLDACESTAAWTVSSGWGVVSADAGHPDRYFADSPSGNYANSVNLRLTSRTRLDLSRGVHAWALFDARWLTEQTYDGTLVEASLDSATWTALPGRGTSPTVFTVTPGWPAYQARRYEWSPERVDLSAFAGPAGSAVRLRFRTFSDGGTVYAGFDFDSLRVLLFDPAQQPVPTAVGPALTPALTLAASPNPVRTAARLRFTLPRAGTMRLAIHDVTGRKVRVLADTQKEAGEYAMAWDLTDDEGRPVPPGLYFAHLQANGSAVTQRIITLR